MADTSQQNPTLLCVMCTKPGKLTCTGCRAIRYCSAVCQKQDWRLHKLLCKSWTEHRGPPLPGLFRGIYLSCDASAPQFVWYDGELNDQSVASFKYTTIEDDIEGSSNAIGFCCSPVEGFSRSLFNSNEGVKKIYLDMDCIRARGNSNQDPRPNKSFTQIDKELVEYRKGPIFAYGIDATKKEFFNLDMANLRHIVDLLRRNYDAVMRSKEQSNDRDAIKGILAMCVGETAMCLQGGSHFKEVKIAMPPRTEGERVCPPATKIGLPIVLRKAAPGISWRACRLQPGAPSPHGREPGPNEQLSYQILGADA